MARRARSFRSLSGQLPKFRRCCSGLSRIDLTNCSEEEARRRLIKGVDMPAPPELKPAFEKIKGEPPDSQHAGPAEKPTFVPVSVDDGVPRWLKISAAIAAIVGAVFTALTFFFAGGVGAERECKTIFGGMVVCGRLQGSARSRTKLKTFTSYPRRCATSPAKRSSACARDIGAWPLPAGRKSWLRPRSPARWLASSGRLPASRSPSSI